MNKKINKQLVVNHKRCTACGDCQKVCPQGILEIRKLTSAEKQKMNLFQRLDCYCHKNNTLDVIDPDKCLGCGFCIKACRHRAIFLKDA